MFVADCTGAGMLYRGSQTLWAAKFDAAPAAMLASARFGGADGMLVTLTEFGHLAVGYLGTAPPVDVVRGYETNKEVGFAEMERERAKLTEMINESAAAKAGGAEAEPAEKIELSARVPTTLDPAPRARRLRRRGDREDAYHRGAGHVHGRWLVRRRHADGCRARARDVQAGYLRGALRARREGHAGFGARGAARPARRGRPREQRAVRLVAGYRVKGTGEPRVATHEARVPLSLFAERVAPVKHAAHKVTLDTNARRRSWRRSSRTREHRTPSRTAAPPTW